MLPYVRTLVRSEALGSCVQLRLWALGLDVGYK